MVNEWDVIADEYSSMIGDKGDYIRQALTNKYIRSHLPEERGQKILDLGCGEGYLARLLNEHQVTGVDSSLSLIDIAKSKNTPGNLVVGDITKPLVGVATSFDVVILNMVLMDIEQVELVLKNAHKHLKSGGTMIISLVHPVFRRPTARLAKTLFDKLFRREPFLRLDNYADSYRTRIRITGVNGPTTIFHRPFSWYINQALNVGLFLENVEELTLSETDIKEFGQPKFLTKFPAVLAMTFKKNG